VTLLFCFCYYFYVSLEKVYFLVTDIYLQYFVFIDKLINIFIFVYYYFIFFNYHSIPHPNEKNEKNEEKNLVDVSAVDPFNFIEKIV
jgi:hypothetical protein